jgi:hypothetical protein
MIRVSSCLNLAMTKRDIRTWMQACRIEGARAFCSNSTHPTSNQLMKKLTTELNEFSLPPTQKCLC